MCVHAVKRTEGGFGEGTEKHSHFEQYSIYLALLNHIYVQVHQYTIYWEHVKFSTAAPTLLEGEIGNSAVLDWACKISVHTIIKPSKQIVAMGSLWMHWKRFATCMQSYNPANGNQPGNLKSAIWLGTPVRKKMVEERYWRHLDIYTQNTAGVDPRMCGPKMSPVG